VIYNVFTKIYIPWECKKETYRKLYNMKNVSEWMELCNKMLKINLCITFLLIMQNFVHVYSHISA